MGVGGERQYPAIALPHPNVAPPNPMFAFNRHHCNASLVCHEQTWPLPTEAHLLGICLVARDENGVLSARHMPDVDPSSPAPRPWTPSRASRRVRHDSVTGATHA